MKRPKWSGLETSDWKRVVWSAVFTFAGFFTVLLAKADEFQNFNEVKVAVLAILPSAVSATLSILKNGFTTDTSRWK